MSSTEKGRSPQQRRRDALANLRAPETPPPGLVTQLEAQRLLLLGRLASLDYAVDLHGKRVVHADDAANAWQLNADGVAFTYALRDLLREVELAIELGLTDAKEARRRFDQSVPRATDVRDVLAHIDEYTLGEGRLQQTKKDQVRPVVGRFIAAGFNVKRTRDGYRLVLVDGVGLDFAVALSAARMLAQEVHGLLLTADRATGDPPKAAT